MRLSPRQAITGSHMLIIKCHCLIDGGAEGEKPMKWHLSSGGLALLLLALAAFLGASPAVAVETTLCKVGEEKCAAGNRYANGQTLKAKWAGWELNTNLGVVDCLESELKGKTNALSGEPLPTEITEMSAKECSIPNLNPPQACAVTSVNLPYSGSLAWIAATLDGQWRWKSSGKGDPGFTVKCGVVISCTFTVTEPILEILGGNPAGVFGSEIRMAGFVGVICPATASWTPAWTFAEPKPLFVAHT
jgi:hypothetical protein